MNSEQRIVITGMGALSPVGLNCQETFDSLVAGHSGIGRVSLFDPSNLACQIAGEVKGFDPADHMDRKMARRIGRYAQFSIAATREALAQSGINLDKEDPSRIACVVSSAIGDFPMLEQQMNSWFEGHRRTISPFTVPRVSTSMAAGNIALEFGLTGVSYGVSSACATGSHSLATAMMILKLGLADTVLAGGPSRRSVRRFCSPTLPCGPYRPEMMSLSGPVARLNGTATVLSLPKGVVCWFWKPWKKRKNGMPPSWPNWLGQA